MNQADDINKRMKIQVKNNSFYPLNDCVAKHVHFESIDSTNTWAKKNTNEWSLEGVTLVTASEQTKGRGRFNRHWESPRGMNIYATFCFWIDQSRMDIGHIPQLLALSGSKVLEVYGFSPLIKWPNDLLLSGKKVGGILCETITDGHLRGVVCGIGLNVNMPQENLSAIDRPATSLMVESGKMYSLNNLLESLQDHFSIDLKKWLAKGFQGFFSQYQSRSYFKKGDSICFHDNQKIIKGKFEKLQSDGSVQLLLQDGTYKIFYAGEFLFS